MTPTLIDILSWIESADNFRNGIGTLESRERVLYLMGLMTPFLSENWDKLNARLLEKSQESLSKIYKRISSLKDHFSNEVEYYENDYYEIDAPHPYEVFPPDGLSHAQVDKMFKADKENEQLILDRIKKNKANIIRDLSGYVTILDCWQPMLLKSLKQIERLLDKTYVEIVQTKNDNDNPQVRVYLKPVNRNDLYSGLSKLLQGLHKLDLITAETELTDIRRLFGFGDLNKKVGWKNVVALRHFLFELERQGKIEPFESRKKYKTASQLFYIAGSPDFDFKKLSSNNGLYSHLGELKRLISNL